MSARDWSMLPWSEMTWSERTRAVICWVVALAIGLAMFVGIALVIGASLDGITHYKSEHDRCLQRATNGLEIKQCH